MKKLILTFIFIFQFLLSYAQNINYFSFPELTYPFDLSTGNNMESPESPFNFNSKKDINRAVINVVTDDLDVYYEEFYKDGLLIKEISHCYELDITNKTYNDKFQILSSNDDFSFVYTGENGRQTFYLNELRSEEYIFIEDDSIQVLKNDFTYTLQDRKIVPSGKTERKFFYDKNGNLLKFTEQVWNSKGNKVGLCREDSFEYNADNKLEKIITRYRNGNIRRISEIVYENNVMTEVRVKNDKNEVSFYVKFSDYDFYGNWHISRTYYGDRLQETVTREIFYY
ncbi:MAG: hypothetical protein ACI4LX_05180 [Treponema sp.]